MQHHFCPNSFPSIPKAISDESRRKQILIVGAGTSGLFAALSLKRMGVANVTVLEASKDIGGRLKAVKPTITSNLELDVGAEWIHSTDGARVLNSMMEGLALDGDEDKNNEVELISYQPKWYFRKRRSKLMETIYKETKFKSATWYSWLKDNVYEKVKDNVELESLVTEIRYDNKQEGGEGKVEVVLANGDIRTADTLICTVPLSILKQSIDKGDASASASLQFNPALPIKVQEAIRAIDMPPGLRVLLQMREKFYPDLTSAHSLFNLLCNPNEVTFAYDATLGKGSEENILAVVAIGNKHAGRFGGMSQTQIGNEALRIVDDLFDGQGTVNLIGDPSVQNWSEEPFVRGAYTFPGSNRHRRILGQSIGSVESGKVIFAGEHTSMKYFSLVPGAAFEGRRAALEAVDMWGD